MKNAIFCIFCLITCSLQATVDDPLLNNAISLPKTKGTVYEMLNKISDLSGIFFIYDAKTIDNNRKAKLSKGKATVKQAIEDVVQDPNIKMKVIGNHILLYKTESLTSQIKNKPDIQQTSDSINYYIIEGEIKDKETLEKLPFTSIRLGESNIGTVSNQNGEFLLKVPDSLKNTIVTFSYIGYETYKVPVELLVENRTNIYMDICYVPIPEIIVGIINPLRIVRGMLDNRDKNYMQQPVLLTTFYREGFDRKKEFINLTEAVFKIYKTPLNSNRPDQVKLLKMRKITNSNENDSILMKFKAGVEAFFSLDLVKKLPDFLSLDENLYNYTKIDMTVIDFRLAHVISFEQKSEVEEPLYKGELYIDAENFALLSARFEINPEYIKKAKKDLVLKQGKKYDIIPKEAVYTVSYKEWNGKYIQNYVRGDLTFNVEKKKSFFARRTPIHTYFEMVVCNIETENIKPFPPKESIPTTRIFSETKFIYDQNFWGNFNIILPEQKLNDNIARISSQIEESIDY